MSGYANAYGSCTHEANRARYEGVLDPTSTPQINTRNWQGQTYSDGGDALCLLSNVTESESVQITIGPTTWTYPAPAPTPGAGCYRYACVDDGEGGVAVSISVASLGAAADGADLLPAAVTCAAGAAGEARAVGNGYDGAVTCPKVSRVCPDGATAAPSPAPTLAPTKDPTFDPTKAPTEAPTLAPSRAPTAPTFDPTKAPTRDPTFAPSRAPTAAPSKAPTDAPTARPSPAPSGAPTLSPSASPSFSPTAEDVCLAGQRTNPDNDDPPCVACEEGRYNAGGMAATTTECPSSFRRALFQMERRCICAQLCSAVLILPLCAAVPWTQASTRRTKTRSSTRTPRA